MMSPFPRPRSLPQSASAAPKVERVEFFASGGCASGAPPHVVRVAPEAGTYTRLRGRVALEEFAYPEIRGLPFRLGEFHPLRLCE